MFDWLQVILTFATMLWAAVYLARLWSGHFSATGSAMGSGAAGGGSCGSGTGCGSCSNNSQGAVALKKVPLVSLGAKLSNNKANT